MQTARIKLLNGTLLPPEASKEAHLAATMHSHNYDTFNLDNHGPGICMKVQYGVGTQEHMHACVTSVWLCMCIHACVCVCVWVCVCDEFPFSCNHAV